MVWSKNSTSPHKLRIDRWSGQELFKVSEQIDFTLQSNDDATSKRNNCSKQQGLETSALNKFNLLDINNNSNNTVQKMI